MTKHLTIPLIWRSSSDGSAVDASFESYAELTQLGWFPDTCKPFPKQIPKGKLSIKGKTKPTDFFFAGPVFVISNRLREVLAQFDTETEFLPLQASIDGGKARYEDFWLVNFLDWVECLDLEKSLYKMTDHGAKGIEHLVIKEESTVGQHLFLIGQIPTRDPNSRAVRDIVRCASQELATAVIESGFTGVTFVQPEHHRTYPPDKVAWSP